MDKKTKNVFFDIEMLRRRLIRPYFIELAVQYTVNPNTAARIYNELEQCGLCYTKRGLGTFVSEDVHLIDTLKAELSSEMIETFISGMTSLGFSKDEIINLIKNYHE